MNLSVKIRGIYTTALTRLVLEGGYSIAEPSPEIKERFGLNDQGLIPDIVIHERDDLQGIFLTGEPQGVSLMWTLLKDRLLDVVLTGVEPQERRGNPVRAVVEFPGASKEFLDELRRSVSPTLRTHHRFRIVNSLVLEQAENVLRKEPEKRTFLSDQLFREIILQPLQKVCLVRLEHVRPSGKPIRPREGILLEADEHRILFKRTFAGGRYDGLRAPINEGDWGLTEILEGEWYVKHTYYSSKGEVKGEYYNVNTPVEFYPYGARYVDLEVDVVRRAGEGPFIIDREKLAVLVQEGHIGKNLEQKAIEVAETLVHTLV